MGRGVGSMCGPDDCVDSDGNAWELPTGSKPFDYENDKQYADSETAKRTKADAESHSETS